MSGDENDQKETLLVQDSPLRPDEQSREKLIKSAGRPNPAETEGQTAFQDNVPLIGPEQMNIIDQYMNQSKQFKQHGVGLDGQA